LHNAFNFLDTPSSTHQKKTKTIGKENAEEMRCLNKQCHLA
jgi:hypothetical protein